MSRYIAVTTSFFSCLTDCRDDVVGLRRCNLYATSRCLIKVFVDSDKNFRVLYSHITLFFTGANKLNVCKTFPTRSEVAASLDWSHSILTGLLSSSLITS